MDKILFNGGPHCGFISGDFARVLEHIRKFHPGWYMFQWPVHPPSSLADITKALDGKALWICGDDHS